MLFLWLYTNIKTRIKFIYGICIIPILYGIAGPIVHLFAISALFFEFLTNGKKKYISIIYLLIAALSAIAGTYLGYSRNLTLAFLPEAYCNPLQTVSGIYYAWYALPMTMLLVAYLKRYKEPVSLKGKCIWEGAQWAIMFLLVYQGIFHFGKLDAQKGQLSERLLDYPQHGIETLMLHWDQSIYTAQLHSDLYYCMGIISAAQKFAFEAFVSSRSSGNPRMLKRLIETNLITGSYPIADKYIQLLEKTWFYKDWATAHRRFLYNDKAVEEDKILGMKRRCWKAEASAAKLYTDPVSSLINLLPACPDNKAGLAYLTSFLLLNKDIETYKTLQESLYRSPAWRDMTECQQEAIVICSPNDPHFWLEHGVSIKVRNRAIAFMQKVQDISRSGQNPAVALASEYDKTYWYYYMFNMMDK